MTNTETARIPVSEESGIHNEWYQLAEKQTPETLPAFVSDLVNKYEHDFGTIIHATAAAALGAAHAVNNSETGNVDSFQGGAVFIEFTRNWLKLHAPFRLMNYEDFLYPQHEHRHKKRIPAEVWEWLQKEAKNQLDNRCAYLEARYELHWRSIIDGKVPFGYKVAKRKMPKLDEKEEIWPKLSTEIVDNSSEG